MKDPFGQGGLVYSYVLSKTNNRSNDQSYSVKMGGRQKTTLFMNKEIRKDNMKKRAPGASEEQS